jgi:hypothetical protein
VGLVGTLYMQSVTVGVGKDRHRAYAHLGASAHDPDSNFTAVGDQDFCYHEYFLDR